MKINKKFLKLFSDESLIIEGIKAAITKKAVPNNYPKPPKLNPEKAAMVMLRGVFTLVVTDEHGNAFEFSPHHNIKDLSTWIDPDTFEFVRGASGMDF